jgi:hypothetical protein
MTKKNNLINEVFKDFKGIIGSRVKSLTFLNKISKSTVHISKKTGTIYHSPILMRKKVYLLGQKNYIQKN